MKVGLQEFSLEVLATVRLIFLILMLIKYNNFIFWIYFRNIFYFIYFIQSMS